MNERLDLSDIRKRIFCEPSSAEVRPLLIDYIKSLLITASSLSKESLLGSEGHTIAMDITGALAFQGAKGVTGSDWITKQDEPLLFDILRIAARLDEDANNSEAWDKLLAKSSEL